LNWQATAGPSVAHNNMAALLIERGDLAGARKELETALSYDRQNGPALFNLALVAERDGKPAVIQVPDTKTSKRPSILAKFFHPVRSSGPAQPVVQTAKQAAEPAMAPAVVPTGSGSGN
jgi:tetratricopeptide (TPR) repeat protein